MTFVGRTAATLALLAAAVLPRPAGADEPGAVEALAIAVDAYIYGYPLVTFDMVRKAADQRGQGRRRACAMGQMNLMRSYPAVDNHCCRAERRHALHHGLARRLEGALGLRDPGDGRSLLYLPFLDGWSEVFAVASQPLNGAPAALLCGSLVTAAGAQAQAQTVEENMAAQAKLHAIPGKQLTADGPTTSSARLA